MGSDDSLFIPSICLDSLLALHTNCESFLTRIAEQDHGHLPLQELDVARVLNVGLLPKVFQKTPALKKLRIFNAETWPEIQFDDVLPVLEEVCCPPMLLQSLVPGRPISSIKFIADEWEITETIQSLFQPSTSRIRSLSVPLGIYQDVWEHFPNLESLRLGSFTRDRYQRPFHKLNLQTYISSISHSFSHSPIQELHLHFLSSWADVCFDLKWQHEVISTIISPKLPQLRRTTICDCVAWDKIQEDDVWKPSLLVSWLRVANQLRSCDVLNLVDYDGFFEQVLSTAEEFC